MNDREEIYYFGGAAIGITAFVFANILAYGFTPENYQTLFFGMLGSSALALALGVSYYMNKRGDKK